MTVKHRFSYCKPANKLAHTLRTFLRAQGRLSRHRKQALATIELPAYMDPILARLVLSRLIEGLARESPDSA